MAILRKIKERLKKIALKNKKSEEKTSSSAEPKKEAFASEKLAIEQAKFSHPEPSFRPRIFAEELPSRYDQDKIVLQVRDPWWLHTYWDIRTATWERLKNDLGDDFYRARRVLRVYDISNIIFNGNNAHNSFDIHVDEHANNWYIDTAGPGRSWCVDFGLLLADGRFIMIVRSNVAHTPLAGPSWITDEEWLIPDDMFARLYGMGFGLGRSSPVGKAWQERLKKIGPLASPGMASMASPVKKAQKRQFWLAVDCELIVYGATEPDASVTVQSKPIKLRPDGTFTLRFALPDGRQVIPVKAESADKIEERIITPTVNRDTKVAQPILRNA